MSHLPEPAPAVPAATIVLLRPGPAGARPAYETFLLERAASSTFMAKAHVFPGGRVDREDRDPAWRSHADGADDLVARLAHVLSADDALAHAVAGIREVFEETGLLLGHTPLSEAALSSGRADLMARRVAFKDWCAASHARLSLGALLPWAHWITPEAEPKRFDTWFFLAAVPADARVSVVAGEVVSGAWYSAAAALAACDAGRLVLAPPTLRTFEEFEPYPDLDALAAAVPARVLAPILPRLIHSDGQLVVLLPGDPHYGPTALAPVAGPTRFIRDGRRWIPASPPRDAGQT